MELRVLQYFLTVVREENISKAAEVLHITQPTLSRQISQLEEELGTQLFVRGRHLTLTDSSVMLRRRAEEVVELIDKIESEFEKQNDISGIISVVSGGLNASKILPDIMKDFHRKYPRVQYELYTNSADHVKERWGILMPVDCPLAEKDFVTQEDLYELSLMASNRLSLQKELANWFKNDLSHLNIFATYNIITNIAMLVLQGIAYALTIEGAVDLFNPDLLVFRPLYPELSMTSVLVWKKFQPFSSASAKFLEYLKSMQFGHNNV